MCGFESVALAAHLCSHQIKHPFLHRDNHTVWERLVATGEGPVFQRCRASVQRAHRPMLRATKVRPFLLTITGLRHDGPRHTSLHWTSNACRTQYDQHTQAHSTRDEAQRFTHTTSDRRKHCPVDQSRGLLQRPKRQHGRHVGLSATSHHSQLRLPYAGISPKLSVRRTRFMTDVSCAWAQRLVISPAGM